MYMKKISLLTLAVVTSLALFAQDQPQLRTPMAVAPRFGIKAGVNLATAALEDIPSGASKPNTNNKTGFHGGVFYNIPLGGMMKFQPELLYSSQGTKTDFQFLGSTQEGEVDLNYLTLPLMVQLQTPGGFYVELGPQLGYMLDARYQPASGSETDLEEYTDKFDFSINGGLGYMTRVGLGIGARYNYGITNAMDSKNTSSPFYNTFREVQNRNIQIGLFYQFGAAK